MNRNDPDAQSNPNIQNPVMLPGGLMIDPAAVALQQMPVVPPGPVNMADPAILGATLTGLGMDPVAAAGVIASVQTAIANATFTAVSQVATAMYRAQLARAQMLQQAMLAMPAFDPLGRNRSAMAQAVGDPSLPITPDPTPGLLSR